MRHTLALLTGLSFLAAATLTTHAASVTFGTGGTQFGIEFVDIGNADNADDTTGSPNPAGKVEYDYRIGKYEISRDMITKASTEGSLGITMQDMTSFGGNGVDRPATGVSWFEAATFVNWLNTSSGGSEAYKFDAVGGTFALWTVADTGFDAANPYRNSLATYWLPSMDEWYKAAYYDPVSDTYFDYATGQNFGDAPTAVTGGTTAGTAVYIDGVNPNPIGPADVDNAGGLSPFGTMGQSGNASEWEETALDLTNDSTSENRGIRGGSWRNSDGFGVLRSSNRGFNNPTIEDFSVGFRVAGVSVVPEPSRTLLGVVGLCGVLVKRRRRSASL